MDGEVEALSVEALSVEALSVDALSVDALSAALRREAFTRPTGNAATTPCGIGERLAVERAGDSGRSPRDSGASMDRPSAARLTLDEEIVRALKNNEFELFLQPQIALKDFSLSGVEVLLRWRHPERGLIAPTEFLAVAEASRQICDIGHWVLRTVCENYQTWRDWMGNDSRVAVNVSPVELLDSRFLSNTLSILGSHGVLDSGVELELIETAVLANPVSARDTIRSLRRNGVRMALDDFGVGYSSLSSLRDYPFTKLKIDRSFVQHLAISYRSRTIVRSMIELGKSLQVEVNAEGVETPEQLQFLFENGCDEVQGYLFARPMPTARFRDWATGFLGKQDTGSRPMPARHTPIERAGNVLDFGKRRMASQF